MAALVAAVLLSVPIYVTGCLEHPTCEAPPPTPEVKDAKEDSPPPTTTTLSPSASAAATTTPPPPTPAVTSPAGVEQWRNLVAAYFPASEVDTALRVMACESGGDPNAYNPSGATGLMQVMTPLWSDEFGYAASDLFDPGINLEVAYQVWLLQGWGAWSCA